MDKTPPQRGSTSAVDRIEGLAQWKSFVRDNFPWLEITSSAKSSFAADVQSHQLGSSVLATIRSADTEVHRTPELAVRADAGYVKLMWQLTGVMEIEQDHRRAVITPGEACVCDTARPYRVSVMENAHFAVLTLPYNALPGWEQVSQKLCGSRLQDVVTAHAALGALMALLRTPPADDPEGTENVLRAIQWMLAASMRRAAQPTASVDPRGCRLGKAQMYVLDHIADPGLDPTELASALHMSRRALYLLFKEYRMTPGRMIHDLRLERCQKALCDPSQESRSMTEIAFDNGFEDAATFSRLFKAQYGMTPSECRRRARGQPGASAQRIGGNQEGS